MTAVQQEMSETPTTKNLARKRRKEADELIRRAPMGYVWNQLGSLWMFAASFLFTIILTHNLSTSKYGDLSSALTIFNTAVYLAAFGIEDATTVFLPRILGEQGRRSTASLIRRTLLVRLIGVLVIATVLIWVIPLVASIATSLNVPYAAQIAGVTRIPGLNALALPIAAYVIGTGFLNQFSAIFTSLLRTKITLLIGGLSQLANLVAAFLLLRITQNISHVLWGVAAVATTTSVIYLILLLPYWLPRTPKAEIPEFAPVLQMGWTAWQTNLVSGALLKQVAFSMLQAFAFSSAVVGYFNLAFQLTHAAAYLLIAGLGGVGMAAMSAAYAGNNRRSLAFAWRAISKIQILLAVPLLGFCFLYAGKIAVALYGPQYVSVGPLMQLFLLFNIAQRLGGGGSHQAALYVIGKQRLALWTQWGGLVVTLMIGILLIPSHTIFNGPAGALVAVGTGQVIVEFVQLAMASIYLQDKYPIRFGIRVVAAMILPMIVTWLWQPAQVLRFKIQIGSLSLPYGISEIAIAVTLFTVILIAGLAIVKPIEYADVELLARINPRLRGILTPFATKRLRTAEEQATLPKDLTI